MKFTFQNFAFLILIVNLTILLCLNHNFSYAASSQMIHGVSDGDTIIVSEKDGFKIVQLYGVDAPENGQLYAEEAYKFVSDIVSTQICNVKIFVIDSVDIGEVYCTDPVNKFTNDLSCMLLLRGYAFLRGNSKEAKHINSEKTAKNRKAGIWSQDKVEFPWVFREKNNLQEEEYLVKKYRDSLFNDAVGKIGAGKAGLPKTAEGALAMLAGMRASQGVVGQSSSAKNGKFYGNLNSNPYDPDSIANPYGRYGSKYSPDSINNPYGAGNPYDPNSPTNPYGEGLKLYGR